MRLGPISRFVSYACLAVGGAMIVPWILAWSHAGESPAGYLLGIFISLSLGGLFLAVGLGYTRKPIVRSGMRELFLALLIFWGGIPFLAAIPFVIGGMPILDGWFEAVSALTTTGGWLSDPAAHATDHDMIYRASLQWLGGLVTLATAGAVFVRPEFTGVAPLVPPFSRGESGSFIRAFDRAVWTFLPVYACITAAGFLCFLFAEVPIVDAATMAMSFLSTGGFVPAAGGILSYSPAAISIAMILMCFGAVNFIVISGLVLSRSSRMRSTQDEETAAFIILLPLMTLLYWLSAGAGDLDLLIPQFYNAVSILSTNGQIIGESPALLPVLVTAVIGGAAVSTAGGVKLMRWLVTIRRTGQELWKLTHPGGVLGKQPHVNELGIWIHALAFTMLLALIVLLTAFFGHPLETSATAAVAVVANAGPLIDLAPQMTADYARFEAPLRGFLGLAMIAGRLELVVFMVMLSRRFWLG